MTVFNHEPSTTTWNYLYIAWQAKREVKRDQTCSPFLVSGWTNEDMVERSALSSNCALKTIFWNGKLLTNAGLQQLDSRDYSGRLRQLHRPGRPTGPTPSLTVGLYNWPAHPPTLHMHVATLYSLQARQHKVVIRLPLVSHFQNCAFCRWAFSLVSPTGRSYADGESATTLDYVF